MSTGDNKPNLVIFYTFPRLLWLTVMNIFLVDAGQQLKGKLGSLKESWSIAGTHENDSVEILRHAGMANLYTSLSSK